MEAKAVKQLAVLRALRQSTWGINMVDIRTVYITTLIPQILYCASVWYSPESPDGLGPARRSLKAFEKIQTRAARTISGTWRTTTSESLNIETYLLPAHLKLQETCFLSLIRMATSPQFKTITDIRNNAISTNQTLRVAYQSPLQMLQLVYETVFHRSPQILEIKLPFTCAPFHEAPEVQIALTPESALARHFDDHITADAHFLYTDGSRAGNHVGSSAYSYNTGKSRSAYLRPATDFNNFLGELYGIYLAIQIAKTDTDRLVAKDINIYSDCQHALKAVHNPGN